MTSISSSLPAQTYLALPSPASFRTGGTTQKATKPVANSATDPQADDYTELQPVAAVPLVTRQPQQADSQDNQTDNGGTGSGTAGSNAGTAAVGQRTATPTPGAADSDQTQSNRPRVAVASTTGQPSTGFITQSLSQEKLGAGLHIEPWRQALSSYLSAAALPASALSGSLVSLTV